VPDEPRDRLVVESNLHADAAVASSLEDNNRLFADERERLEKWAEDKVAAAERSWPTQGADQGVRRQSRLATTLDEQNDLQNKLSELEKKQRKQRQEIFESKTRSPRGGTP